MSKPEVRKFLTVSASHLPESYANRVLSSGTFCGVYGTMLWAPEEFEEHDFDDMPDSVRDILIYARRTLKCDYVLFDRDGEALDEFPTFEGDEVEQPL